MSDTRERYHELQKYSKYLKSGLKSHQGVKLDKDGKIYKKFKIYQNLKKLIEKWKINNHDENVVLKVNSYYELLKGKIKKMKINLEEKNKVETQTAEDETEERLEDGREDLQQENEAEVDEIGPTPQLNGRVLSLFDIQTSPIKSPIQPLNMNNNSGSLNGCKLNLGILLGDNSAKIDDAIFKTPTTKRIVDLRINETPGYLHCLTQRMSSVDEVLGLDEWSDIGEGDVSEDDNDYEAKKEKRIRIHLRKKENTEEHIYNWDNDFEEDGIEPSPLIKKCSKSLFDMHNELGSLKKNLKELMQEEMIGIKPEEENKHSEEMEKQEINLNRHENGSDINKEEQNKNENEKDDDDDTDNGDDDDTDNGDDDDDDGNDNNDDDDDDDGLKEIKQENKTVKESKDDEEIKQQFMGEEIEFDNEKVKEAYDPHAYLRKKAKTIKRSTKRSRLKTIKIGPIHDEYEDVNLHDIINKSKNEDNTTDDDDDETKNIEYEEENGDNITEEEVYVRKDFSDLLSKQGKGKGKGKHPLSNNFVRLKINNKRKRRR